MSASSKTLWLGLTLALVVGFVAGGRPSATALGSKCELCAPPIAKPGCCVIARQ
jgi:hypothetical protein